LNEVMETEFRTL